MHLKCKTEKSISSQRVGNKYSIIIWFENDLKKKTLNNRKERSNHWTCNHAYSFRGF